MKTNFPTTSQSLEIYSDAHQSSTAGMFIEDIHTSIMPFNGESKNFPEFKASFIGEDSEDAIKICENLMQYDSYNSDDDLISQSIQSIAHNLAVDGLSIYEILYNVKEKNIFLNSVSGTNIYNILCGYIQIAPNDKESDGKRFNFLSNKNIWFIEMPSILGERKGYKKIISKLNSFDSSGPDFYLTELQNSNISQLFDYKEYRLVSHIFTTQSTLNWSWDQRDLDREDKTEFYSFYQDLEFYWAQATLRVHIVKEMNNLFNKLDIRSHILISGIPTPKEILKFKRDYINGEKTFDDVIKFLLY